MVQAGDMLGLVRAEVGRILGFRCEHGVLGNSPLYMMVDEGRLAEVVDYIERLLVDMDSGLRRNDEKAPE